MHIILPFVNKFKMDVMENFYQHAGSWCQGTANMLNFNVAEGLKLSLPNQFWTRLSSTFGNTFFVRENGEDVAIRRAVDTIDYCLRDELAYCVDVPLQFKVRARARALTLPLTSHVPPWSSVRSVSRLSCPQNPSQAMYGAQDPAAKLFGDAPAKGLFDGISSGAEKIFGS